MTATANGRSSRVAEIDGVRGLAILLVLGGHAVVGPVAAAGVTLFFGLSGYLITSILLREREKTGRVELSRFYMRRLTRLGPPLFVMVAIITLLHSGLPWNSVVAPLTWTANYFRIFDYEIHPFGHTWSLAVEEQFYLVWPLLLLLLANRSRPVRALAILVGLLLAWRLALSATGLLSYAYHAIETAGSTILLGCLLAWSEWKIRSARLVTASAAGLVALPVGLRLADLSDWIPLAVTPLVGIVVAGSACCPWLSWRWLGFAGVTSYSMYLWHEPIDRLLFTGDGPSMSIPGVALGALIGLLAYKVVEKPVMAWRARN